MSTKRPQSPWLAKEEAILRSAYPTQGVNGCAAVLVRHTRHAVHMRAKRLGLRQVARWTSEEDEVLREVYPARGTRGAITLLKARTKEAIRGRVEKLGLSRDFSGRAEK